MLSVLVVVGLVVAFFVGFNIGGSSTGVAFGPAVGSRVTTKTLAAALMSVFALLGGWTVGRGVIQTMGGRIVPSPLFTIEASVAVLFFVGLALLISNLFGVPASTSMTAVGAIAGLGVASGQLNESVMLEIVAWWLVAPVLAFWVCAVIGRYLYVYLMARFHVERAEGPIFEWSTAGPVRYPSGVHPGTSVTEVGTSVLVVAIGCYMAFSAGASNVANAVAPLVGSGSISTDFGILLAGGAIALGAFTIARRTLDTVGNDLTDLPLLAALIVEVVSASLITFLSYIDIPASLAVSATMCIVGLGWGRATRTTSVAQAAEAAVTGKQADEDPSDGDGAGEAEDGDGDQGEDRDPGDDGSVPPIGEPVQPELTASDLFDPATVGRVISLWILTPSLSAVTSYLLFTFYPIYGG